MTNSDDCDDTDGAVYPGGTCNDGNACTINDVYDANCNCVGTFADADGDGVCDADDACPGFDDSLDADGDGIPDGCDNNNCVGTTTNFTPDPLTHQGTGSSVSTLNFGGIHQDVSFDIIDINQKDNGRPSTRYIDVVTVEYDQAGATLTVGVFDGNSVNSVPVDIAGNVASVTVTLEDVLDDGVTQSVLSVDFTQVTSCAPAGPGSVWQPFSGESENELDVPMDLRLFPNPARDELTVRYGLEVPAAVRLQITDLNGRTRHLQQQSLEAGRQEARLAGDDLPAGVYLLHLWKGSEQETRRFVIVR